MTKIWNTQSQNVKKITKNYVFVCNQKYESLSECLRNLDFVSQNFN